MTVDIATEDAFGGPDERGHARAVRIQTYLRDHYRDYGYLMLIGDPGTQYGDMPMLKVHPRSDMSGICGEIDCETAGTDAAFANPIGNWDLDGNGEFGEYGKDNASGGVDLRPEMAVGRIPVYFGNTQDLDTTLSHIISYMNASAETTAYRKKALFAKAFIFFRGEVFFPNTPPISQDTDDAVISEWFIKNYLPPSRGITATRLYEREGVVSSSFPSDQALTQDNFIAEWKKGYGMIWWGGHGQPRGVARTVWANDKNKDGLADGELSNPPLIDSDHADLLEGAPGGFVVASSCLVGRVEVPDALSYKLLLRGAAVGVVASSAPASVDNQAFDTMGPVLNLDAYDLDRAGAMVFDELIRGETVGKAMSTAKAQLAPSNDIVSYAQKLMTNFYGDPSLSLYDSIGDVER
jgi:hypothetical protein